MQRNANDGIGSAMAATFPKLATILTNLEYRHSYRRSLLPQPERFHSASQRFEGSAKPTRMSALLALPLLLAAFVAIGAAQSPTSAPAKSEPIPLDQIGAVAGKQY